VIPSRAIQRVALFCLCLLSFSCRESDDTVTGSQPIAFSMKLVAGETYLYDAVALDEFGYTIPSTRSRASWKILRTSAAQSGFSWVATILDSSSILRSSPGAIDTVMVASTPGGDLYRHGFLASIARIRNQPVPADAWECIAAFSAGAGASWVVGYQDLGRSQPVYGRIAGATDMFSVKVKGQEMVYPAYRVDLSGVDFDFVFWVADAPAGFLLFRLEPNISQDGAQLTLSEVR
jgi:hypothetical protein